MAQFGIGVVYRGSCVFDAQGVSAFVAMVCMAYVPIP